MTEKKESILAALIKINKAIVPIKKEQTNTFQGYNFRGIDQVYNTLQGIYVEHHVMVFPRVMKRESSSFDSKDGKKTFRVEQEMIFKLECLDDGSFREIGPIWGEALDTSDKATNKSNSAASKYAFIMAHMIPTEGLVDGDSENPEVLEGSKPPLGEYVVKNGKLKDKKLKDSALSDIQTFADGIHKHFNGKIPKGGMQDDYSAATNYLKEQEK